VKSKASASRAKNKSAVVIPEEFPVFLGGVMHAKKKSPKDFAASLGISPQLLYMLLNGRRAPSASVLGTLGLQVAYLITGSSVGRPEDKMILTAPELKMFVVVKMQMSGLDIHGYAELLGIHHQTLYAIIAGYRMPSKSLMKKLKLETVYVDASMNQRQSK
jgi:predicted transcriptional regulator